jgi:hypothetical protein
MQEGKEKKGRWYQEVVSITQKAHKHSKTANDFQEDVLPRTVFDCYDKMQIPYCQESNMCP